MPETESKTPFPHEIYQVYQDGKMKRYGLLFAVNGGAFAILKFSMAEMDTIWIMNAGMPVLMIIFTFLIVRDIWAFGTNMRDNTHVKMKVFAFGKGGQRILLAICTLIVAAWLMLAAIGLIPCIGG